MRHSYIGIALQRRQTLTLALAVIILLAAITPLAAQAQTITEPIQVGGTPELVSGGPGFQGDPHVSGSLMTYTLEDSHPRQIYYLDLETGLGAVIPTAGNIDMHSDVSGTNIVFRRSFVDSSVKRVSIMAFDASTPETGPIELDPQENVYRDTPGIGGNTVAWMEYYDTSSVLADIVAFDLASNEVTRLTSDGPTTLNKHPNVSPDGNVVTWSKCTAEWSSTNCHIYAVSKDPFGAWSAPVQITDTLGSNWFPTSNGQVIAYSSNAGTDQDIWWANIDGSNRQQLAIPGRQMYPSISGNLIAFGSEAVETGVRDLFVYNTSTGHLYQITNTSDVNEGLSDLSVAPDGSVRVVWSQREPVHMDSSDVYTLSFQLVEETAYEVCPLFDQTRSYKVKSTIPIKLQICDEQGGNLSSPALAVSATGLVKQDSTSSPVVVEDSGNANPDSNFRYDESLQGYVYNLSTKNLSAGTWQLHFTVSGDPTLYSVTFDLR